MTEKERNGLSGEILTKYGISIRPNDEFIILYALIKGAVNPLSDFPTQEQMSTFLKELKSFEAVVGTLANMPTPERFLKLITTFDGLEKHVDTLERKVDKPKVFNLFDVLYIFLSAIILAFVFLISYYLYKKI